MEKYFLILKKGDNDHISEFNEKNLLEWILSSPNINGKQVSQENIIKHISAQNYSQESFPDQNILRLELIWKSDFFLKSKSNLYG